MTLSLNRYRTALTGLVVLLPLLVAVAAGLGAYGVAPWRIPSVLLHQGDGYLVLTQIRFPRVAMALVVGASLGVSGASLQGLFRNPLADPGLIGISAGAGLGAGIWIVLLGGGVLGMFGLPAAAFAGAAATTFLVWRMAQSEGGLSTVTLLLAGIALNSLVFAGIGLLTFLSTEAELRTLTFWLMGSLAPATWQLWFMVLPMSLVGVGLLLTLRRDLNALALGEREAFHLGVKPQVVTRKVIVGCALSVGAAVSATGAIGFVGLVVPHLLRLWAGPDHRFLLPASALLGGLLLMMADLFARTVVSPAELPVGILTAMLGAPLFLFLLRQEKRKGSLVA